MQLNDHHIEALKKAQATIKEKDYLPYLNLKQLLLNSTSSARNQFRTVFINYYGLNTGGLTDEFKDRFFEILFGNQVIVNGVPNFREILVVLSQIKRKKGDYAMPFSFVSKLVAIHLETSPIYDRHVLNFFNEKAPGTSMGIDKRIAWYIHFLNRVKASYTIWADDPRVRLILNRLKACNRELETCHVVRLLDFLVWKVGNQKLLTKYSGSST